jgi:hypothetical protein
VVLAVAAVAAVLLLVVHPFGHQAPKPVAQPSPRRPTATLRSVPPSPSGSPTPSFTPSPSPSPSPSGTFSRQQAASGLAALLARSVTDRDAVSAAYNGVLACGGGLSQDAHTFRGAAASRRRLLRQLTSMPGRSVLSQQMLGDLTTAWQSSMAADADFAAWAQDQAASGCTPNDQADPNFQAANGPDRQATASKRAFIRLWNPLAGTYGLTSYRQDEL